MLFKYLNLVPVTAWDPITRDGSQSTVQDELVKKRKTTQYDLAKINTWGIIIPFDKLIEKQRREYEPQCNNTKCTSYNYCIYFWRDTKHMIKLDISVFDVENTSLSKCGNYLIIKKYGVKRRLIFDIYKQLMFTYNNKYLDDILEKEEYDEEQKVIKQKYKRFGKQKIAINEIKYIGSPHRYDFIKFSDDFTKVFLKKYQMRGKKIISSSTYAICLASGHVYQYDYNW